MNQIDDVTIKNDEGVIRPFLQKSRISLHLNEMDNVSAFHSNSLILRSYDLVAVVPTNEKMFHIACTQLDVDIISFDISAKIPFFLNKSMINAALSRGIIFEIIYSPALQNMSYRKSLFSNALNIVRITRGRNIIISRYELGRHLISRPQ